MHHFFVNAEELAGERIVLTGSNYRHAHSVLRLRPGEHVLVSDGTGTDYECEVLADAAETEGLPLRILFREQPHELPAEVWLFQALPKVDKMELIVQKAVELGARGVVPVRTKNAVVKLDEKKGAAKTARWQAIAEAAAKQSKRSLIPEITAPVSFQEALRMTDGFSLKLIPYENADDIGRTMEQLRQLRAGEKVAVFIGPEGGFAPEEIEAATAAGLTPITLGKRILRTETAAICALSVIMLMLESGAATVSDK